MSRRHLSLRSKYFQSVVLATAVVAFAISTWMWLSRTPQSKLITSRLRLGMTEQEVIAILGEPTSTEGRGVTPVYITDVFGAADTHILESPDFYGSVWADGTSGVVVHFRRRDRTAVRIGEIQVAREKSFLERMLGR